MKRHRITSDMQTSHWLRQCDMYLANYRLSDGQRRTLETIRLEIKQNNVVTKRQIDEIKQTKWRTGQ